uniref:Protein C n=1 Tax=Morbillivirus caprinae TaxID=3052343 RepID=A9QUZ0_9MONO|nr:C protein [Peste des petits ruminants virus]UZH56898.1 C protein [Peste des petits ruminants virus]
MSTRDWNVSSPSKPLPQIYPSSEIPLRAGERGLAPRIVQRRALVRPRESIRISTNHAHQQSDQAKLTCLLKVISDLERSLTMTVRQGPGGFRTKDPTLKYSVTMFIATGVKRLKDSRMLTLSWFKQILQLLTPSVEEKMDLTTAMWTLAQMIPAEILYMTGDLLPAMMSLGPQMSKN